MSNVPQNPATRERPAVLDGKSLTPRQVEAVACGGARVRLAPAARRAVAANRRGLIAAAADGEPHYGVNTGFGSLARQRIAADELEQLQRNLVRSHAAGAGVALPEPIVRGTMLCLAASLARACSGVRPVVIERLAALLNAGITPVVPETGSVGASGDLAPLAHVALAVMGEGRVTWRGKEWAARDALRRAQIAPVTFAAKEGLALINGTHVMTARLALLRRQWENVFPAALVATAMSLDACRATDAFLDERVYRVRNQPGAGAVAAELRRLMRGSKILPSHRENDPRVQDPYSFRCAAIVLGAVCDTLGGVWAALGCELGAVTDNPLVFSGATQRGAETIVSAGNFHGMPVALPLDVLAIALAHVAGIAERRVYHMISAFDPESHLKAFLTSRPGLNSGLMVSQYTAAAACNELIGLANPASVANLSTCAGMEDYNSFGPRAAAKAERAMDLVTTVVAIELMCGAQGLEYHRPLKSSPTVEAAHAVIRRRVKKLIGDRPLAPDIAAIRGLVQAGEFREFVKHVF
ncbi:MAG TPA: histidine ammonia-lyase [Opitutus sp.]|nr:histidine ammonia-lyase [Opitutus sp.]